MVVVGLATWTAFAASVDGGHVGVVHDDGIYLVSARALHDGLAYGLPNRPGFPPPKYPIGLPLVIAAALKVAPGNPSLAREIAVARSVVIASGLIFFLAAYVWLRRVHVGPWSAALVVLATAFNHVALIGGASTIFADLPFCAATYGLFARWARPRSAATAVHAAGDGVLAGVCLFLRGNGVTMVVAALVAAWLAPKRWAALGACGLGLAAVILLVARYPVRPAHPLPSGSYSVELGAAWTSPYAGARVVAHNALSVVRDFPLHVVFPNAAYTSIIMRGLTANPAAAWGLRGMIGGAVLLGARRLWRGSRAQDAPVWFHVAGSLAIFLVWPWNSVMDRLMLPLFPLVLLAFGTGVAEAARLAHAGPALPCRLAIAALALALLSNFSVAARAVARFHANGRQWDGASHRTELASALARIAELESDAVVGATWPETVSLYTGRRALPLVEDDQLMLRASGDSRRLKRWLALAGERPCYLLVRNPAEDPAAVDRRQVGDLATDPCYRLRDVYRSSEGRYRIVAVNRSAHKPARSGTPTATGP